MTTQNNENQKEIIDKVYQQPRLAGSLSDVLKGIEEIKEIHIRNNEKNKELQEELLKYIAASTQSSSSNSKSSSKFVSNFFKSITGHSSEKYNGADV